MTCWNPFVEFRCNVSVYSTCCPAWLTNNGIIGEWARFTKEVDTLSPWEIWNHPIFQSVRMAVLMGDFQTYCSKCSRIIAGHLEGTIEPWMKPIMELPPKRLWLEHDRHCQLACPSCRGQIDGHLPYQDQRDQKILEICREFLPTADELTLMSSGEPLVSRSSLEILSWMNRYPNIKVELFTNGLLLPTKWESLPDNIKRLNFSIDAATDKTYERVRWPARWSQIKRSLEFVADLRRRGELEWVQLNMVVQQTNFQEIPDFIQMVEDYGFDIAHMACILPVWHSPGLFHTMNVCDPNHPQHKEFLHVMTHEKLDSKIALYPTIQQFRK